MIFVSMAAREWRTNEGEASVGLASVSYFQNGFIL